MKRAGAILLMAGLGERLGQKTPKQFLFLGGKRVYQHSLETLSRTALFEEIVLVCPEGWLEIVSSESPLSRVVLGGATRQESTYCGLRGFSTPPEIVLVHESARPFVSSELVIQSVKEASSRGSAVSCIPSPDTLLCRGGQDRIDSIPNREALLRGQTPQAFRFEWLQQAHERAIQHGVTGASEDGQLVLQAGFPLFFIQGTDRNFKITTDLDFNIAEFIISLT